MTTTPVVTYEVLQGHRWTPITPAEARDLVVAAGYGGPTAAWVMNQLQRVEGATIATPGGTLRVARVDNVDASAANGHAGGQTNLMDHVLP